jgi:nicotinamide-nucleotide amidase
MFAEIITIGDELLIGQVVDTNSAWMGRELNQIGIEVQRIVSVRDRADKIASAIDEALSRVNLVLMTGGLGPTKDDITKQVLCSYFHTRLIYNEEVERHVRSLLAGRADMNKFNVEQCYIPESAVMLPNRIGTAPVMWFEQAGRVLVSMPGVPQEMKAAMTESVLPRISTHFVLGVIKHRTFIVYNHPESMLAEKLENWEAALPACATLAYLPAQGYVRLRLTVRGEGSEAQFDEIIERETDALRDLLGMDFDVESGASIEELIGIILRDRNLSLSTAESCTGGRIAARITSVPGSSDYFTGGVVAYDNRIKQEILHVRAETLREHGAVSRETVIEMARGACKYLQTDCAVATSGIAGPSGGTPEKPVGTIWIAIVVGENVRTHCIVADYGREQNVERAVNKAIRMLWEQCTEI